MTTQDLRFSEEHEWVRVESGEIVVIGISQHAGDELGDIVFLELPEVNTDVEQFEKFGEIDGRPVFLRKLIPPKDKTP